MESDDEFDMLPVKRRGAPVLNVTDGIEAGLNQCSDFISNVSHPTTATIVESDILNQNGIDNDEDLLPVKRRSGPTSHTDLAGDSFHSINKSKLPDVGSNRKDINIDTHSMNSNNGLSYGSFTNSQNGLSFSDLNEDNNDSLPVKRRGVPAIINDGESFVKHRGRICESLGDDPFDNTSMQLNGSLTTPVHPIEVTGSSSISKPVDSNGLSDVLQNEMLYNPLVNVFDRLGLKEDSSDPIKEERNNSNIYNISSVDYLSNNNSVDNVHDNDYLACRELALRKPKGVSFDLEDGCKEPVPVNPEFLPKSDVGGSVQEDLGANFAENFQPIELSNFIDGLDFLEQCGNNDTEAMNELQRKSLYVRFDPLCETQGDIKLGKSDNDTNVPSQNKPVVPDIKPVKEDNLLVIKPFTSVESDLPEENKLPAQVDDLFSPVNRLGPSKAGNDLKELYPTVNEPDLNLTGLVEPLLYTQTDMDEIIKKAKLDLDDDVHAREMDWKKKYEELESKIKEEVAMRELIEQDYREKIDCLRKDNLDVKQVLSQYERTIVELTESTHRDNKSNEDTLAETIRAKEQLQDDLNSAEQTLFDTLKRVEKLKQAIDTYKQNEDRLKENNADLHTKLQKSEERYEKLREHVTKKIDDANLLISKERKQKEVDLAGLQAALKKAQNKANNLELEIQQKSLENQQLAQICDDLIKKVSGD